MDISTIDGIPDMQWITTDDGTSAVVRCDAGPYTGIESVIKALQADMLDVTVEFNNRWWPASSTIAVKLPGLTAKANLEEVITRVTSYFNAADETGGTRFPVRRVYVVHDDSIIVLGDKDRISEMSSFPSS